MAVLQLAEYFSAVGYEFAVIGLGILWLAIIVAVIAIPIVITKWALNGKFATRKWKKFCDLFKEAVYSAIKIFFL